MPRLPPGLPALLAVQVAAEAAVALADLWLSGGVGLVLPGVAGAVAAGAYGYALRRRRACTRAELRRLGLGAGLAHVLLGAGAYALAWSQDPGLYEFGAAALPLAAACVGVLVGGLALVAATCALDLGVHAAGGVREPVPVPRSFREPPG